MTEKRFESTYKELKHEFRYEIIWEKDKGFESTYKELKLLHKMHVPGSYCVLSLPIRN